MSYQETVKRISELSKEIEEVKQKKAEATIRARDGEAFLNNLAEEFKKSVLEGGETGIKKIESETMKVTTNLKRDRALLEALDPELVRLQAELDGMIRERDRIFSELAKKWINKAIKDYDQSVESLRLATNRLTACAGLLREAGALPFYLEAVGETVASILPSIKIPKIQNFDIGAYREGRFVYVSEQLKETVKREITEGK